VREILGTRGALAGALIAPLAAAATVVGATGFLTGSDRWHAGGAEDPVLGTVLGSVMIALAAVPSVLAIPLLLSEPLVRDRASGALSNQLATPLSPLQFVLGRAGAVWLPTVVPAVVLPLAALGVIDTVAVTPALGRPFIPGWLIVTSVVAVPLLFAALTVLTVEFGMLASPDVAIAPSYVVGIIVLAGPPLLSIVGGVDLTGAAFCLVLLGVALLFLGVALVVGSMLSKERIALASG
jgi:ABC-2 type transport system permease protein